MATEERRAGTGVRPTNIDSQQGKKAHHLRGLNGKGLNRRWSLKSKSAEMCSLSRVTSTECSFFFFNVIQLSFLAKVVTLAIPCA